MEKIKKFISSYKKLVDKKPYIEFITAILSVPVLITIILVNLNNLNSEEKSSLTPTPEVKKEKIYIPFTDQQKNTKENSQVAAPSSQNQAVITSSACKPGIGPVSISSPDEGDTVTDNAVAIIVNYKANDYCAVIWSYSINGGSWSAYNDTSIVLYNLPAGKIKVDVKVKSVVTGDVQALTRNFIYKPTNAATTPGVTSQVQGSSTSAK
jgi:hypothetical protein